MEGSESGEQFLHQKDPKLHTTSPVEHENTRRRTGRRFELETRKQAGEEKPKLPPISDKPADKIADFLEIIEKTHMGHKDDPRVIERIKDYYHKEYAIKPENIPQSYWDLQGEIAINEGRKKDLINTGVLIKENTIQNPDGISTVKRTFTFPQDLKEQAVHTVISNQKQSLDKWIYYLTSDDAIYPMWAKYWAFRSVVKMGKLEKTENGKARFATREKNTVASFPVLNPRALANTIGAMSAQLEAKGKPKEEELEEKQIIQNLSTTLSGEEYQKLLITEDFSKLYAQFLSEIPEYSTQGLEETRGKWIKYRQGSDPTLLVESLEGHPLEWCTADIDTARTQLEAGDFYVYYSLGQDGNPTIPRLAIRMEGARIAEPPRGIAHNQHLDPYILDILEGKLKEFGSEGEAFKKRASDMRLLTEIDKKTQTKTPLTSAELRFLYEIDGKIEGFGYDNQGRDPRIAELRSKRNPEEDMPIVFGCEKSQIARSIKEIKADTKAYVAYDGTLEEGIFQQLQNQDIEYIYIFFPEGRIQIDPVGIQGSSSQQLEAEMDQVGIHRYEYIKDILQSPDYEIFPSQTIPTVKLKLSALGINSITTTAEIIGTKDDVDERGNPAPFTKGIMTKFGLEFCPPEVGPRMRIEDKNQPMNDWYNIAMKPITDRDGYPIVFKLGRYVDGLWLHNAWAEPGYTWGPEYQFVFSLRKSETQNTQTPGLLDRIFRR